MKSPFRLLALVLTLSLAGMPQLAVAQTIEELFQQAGVAQSTQNYAQMESILRRAIQLYPNNANAYYGLGVALRNQGKLEEALQSYRQAIKLDPKYARAYYYLGSVLYHQKKLDEALKSYRKAIELDPNFASAYYGVGNVLRDQKKLDESLQSYRQAIRHPQYP